MADDLNSLLQANRSASVLQGIANPPQINPLAAMNSAVSAATGVYNLRGAQAQEAWGQALQQATDPATGTVDYPKAASIAAGNPRAAQGMLSGLTGASNLRGAQTDQATGLQTLINKGFASVLLDTSDTNINTQADELIRKGVPPNQVNSYRERLLAIPAAQAEQRRLLAHNGLLTSIDPAAARSVAMGSTSLQNLGGVEQPVITTQSVPGRPGTVTPAGAGIARTLTPGEATDIVTLEMEDGTKRQVTRELGARMVNASATLRALNPGFSPTAPAAPAPTIPNGGRYSGGQGQGGGGAPQPAPGGTGTPAPAATAPAPTPTPQFQTAADRADAVYTNRPPPQVGVTPPPTFADQQKAGQARASQMEGEAALARTRLQPLLATMLPELEAVGNTGAGQKTLSFVQQMFTRSGLAPPRLDPKQPQGSAEALNKAMTLYQGAQLQALGTSPSDSRQTLAEGMSPSMGYSAEGNRKIIHTLMGNNDALDVMGTAWMKSQTRANSPGSFDQWREAFTRPVEQGELKGARFDPTIFAVNRMPAAEQYRYLKDLQKASPGDYEQFKKNFALGQREGWVKPLGGQ